MTSYVIDGRNISGTLISSFPDLVRGRILAPPLEDRAAIDVHVHIEVGPDGDDHLSPDLREAVSRYFKGDALLPSIDEVADYYRQRSMVAVVFGVDSALTTGQPRIPNSFVVEGARRHPDVLLPFASIDPRRGPDGVAEAEELLAAGEVRGFKFHPNIQQFDPNDRLAYPLYEVIQSHGSIALFHTGHSGIGAGLPGGGGIRLKHGNPMLIDDVAVDFPHMKIIMAHPSFPWQDEALSVALHKPQVYIDLSGWTPKRFPPQLVLYMKGPLKRQVLFGSDFPLITPDRWIDDFRTLGVDEEIEAMILKDNAAVLLGLDGERP
jgi:predicted TIM-barrel fold metal-dependent hydrolase